jgi:uncharacterized phage-associated protein
MDAAPSAVLTGPAVISWYDSQRTLYKGPNANRCRTRRGRTMTTNICPPSTTAAAAANEFLNLAGAEGLGIDQMKLQKLLFYAHGYNLAIRKAPLFEQDFEAWPWGPVVRDIYFQTRDFGRQAIDKRLHEIRRTGEGFLDYNFVTPTGVEDVETREFVKSIWDSFKGYSGIQLSNATHAPGEPWTIIRDRFGTLDHKPTIPNELIADVFAKKLEVAASNPAPR